MNNGWLRENGFTDGTSYYDSGFSIGRVGNADEILYYKAAEGGHMLRMVVYVKDLPLNEQKLREFLNMKSSDYYNEDLINRLKNENRGY
jgi:hypothetical protein